MSSEIFQLGNPVMLCLILKFKLGTVEHLEELTTCSRAGRTVWRKVRVCSFVFGVLTNLSWNHTDNLTHFGLRRCFFCIQFISWNVPQLRIIETVVLNCKSQFRCIYIGSAEFCWISLVWLDRTHTNDIKLSK